VRRALHLGVQKALGVVTSHYQVDLEADALAAPATDILTEDFTDFLFPDAPPAGGPQA
jgi:hypothetical protein